MFGSTNPFGQSSSSPFGSQSVFGQTSSVGTNPFAPKPFGSPTTPFGSQTGSSLFGGTSTGVFGQPSTPTFGASSASAFGSSVPAFGTSSAPSFGGSSSSFGGSSLFGQKPAFGAFGSSPSQSSPFSSTFQQTQPAFGSNVFGSTSPFGASQPAFGASSTPATPAFGASTPAFGATTAPGFGATTAPFGTTTTPAFGSTSTSLFGSTGTGFGVSSAPAFGSTPAFGASSASVFGSTTAPAFGASSTPAFGASSVPAFGASSTPSFSFGSTPSFGQSTSTFGSSPFGSTPSPFGAQSSPFSAQSTTPTFGSPGFGQPTFGGQAGGSRIAPYTPTPEVDGGTGTQPAGKLESISAMPVYKDKSHEELRWEDYQRGDKGGPNPSGQPASGISFPAPTQSSPFGATGTFGQTAANPFSSTTSSNPFALKTPAFGSTGFGSSSTSLFSSPFSSSSTSSPFGATSSTTPSLFGAPTGSAFGPSSSSSPFGGTTTPAFGSSSSPSIFGSSMAGSTSSFGSGLTFGNTQSSGLFQSSTPAFGQTPSPFGQTSTGFQQSSPAFGSNLFSTPSTGFGGSLFSSSTPSLFPSSTPSGFGQTAPSLSTPFPAPLPAQTSSGFSFGNFGQTPPALSGGFGGSPNLFSQSTFGQSTASQSNMVMQPAPITNPFGTLPAMPQMSIGLAGSTPSVQYGISSMPVSEKPPPVRTFSMLVPRHLSQRRIRLPPRRYNLKPDGPKVPFYADEEEAPSTPKADAFFIPRENPRALIIRPIEQWPLRNGAEKQTISRDEATPEKQNGKVAGEPSAPPASEPLEEDHDDYHPERRHTPDNNAATPSPSRPAQKANGIHDGDHTPPKGFQAAIAYEHGADIEALMPKLRHADGYYTEPRVQELAAKERAEPGFCRRVKDFVVGRRGYGSIKFYGETDIRALDLELIVQFNNREVIVYKDENRKPPVGQGLNKPAEVTLLNIKCVNKKTGQQYTEGPRVEKYKEMLMKKAEEQGAEFVSYDAVKGEWKFRVKHFSIYEFGEGDYSDFAES
ncbi:Nuclear pore complex protein NUP98A [Ananas comosus]|uniref:Nucleoporin autopeptidase n=1 Tax=Ananas comosus TaxID=4615 RepID=A0A199UHZ3_ANACO|nr:Nuclear pore complex protein NUP98A [Ananas comosus]